jgi:hypothetical protein
VLGGLVLAAITAGVTALLWQRLAPSVARAHTQKRRQRTFGRVTVAAENIHAHMRVPAVDCDERYGDFECGKVAGVLFEMALGAGALTVPDGVRIVCNADNDIDTGGFVLIAFPADPKSPWGATTGYHNARVVGTCDPERTHDNSSVREALGFFANELNIAIGGLEESRRRRKTRPLARLALRHVRRHQNAAVPSGQSLALATSDAGDCVDMILGQAAVAPEHEISGLVSALECILSIDERDAEHIVAQARAAA